jgi:hypothetical protein
MTAPPPLHPVNALEEAHFFKFVARHNAVAVVVVLLEHAANEGAWESDGGGGLGAAHKMIRKIKNKKDRNGCNRSNLCNSNTYKK